MKNSVSKMLTIFFSLVIVILFPISAFAEREGGGHKGPGGGGHHDGPGGGGHHMGNPPGPAGGQGAGPRWTDNPNRRDNPPGMPGGKGTDWGNPPGAVGGPGTDNPPGPFGGKGTDWETPPGWSEGKKTGWDGQNAPPGLMGRADTNQDGKLDPAEKKQMMERMQERREKFRQEFREKFKERADQNGSNPPGPRGGKDAGPEGETQQ